MTELLRKEWRDARWIIIGLWILAPIASLALKFLLLGGNRFDENASAGGFIPAMLLLYVLAVGADIVAADASSGRISFLAALPVRPRTLWCAKAGFLFGGAAIYLVALLLMEAMFLSLAGLNGLLVFVPGLPKYAFLYAAVAVIAAATMMYSTLIDRGFAAVVAALFMVCGIAALAWHLHPEPRTQAFRRVVLGLSAFLFISMIAGSYFSFTRGRIHLGGRLRRLAFAGGAFALLFVLPVGLTVAGAARNLHVGLYDQDVEVGLCIVDDEEEWAIAYMNRGFGRDPLLGVMREFRFVGVNLEDGRVRDLGVEDDDTDRYGAWFSESGHYVCVVGEWSERWQRTVRLRREYDLETGRQVSLSQPRPDDILHPGRRYANGAAARLLGRGAWEVTLPGRNPVQLAHLEYPYHCENSWGVLINASRRRRTSAEAPEWILRIDTGGRLDIPAGLDWEWIVLLPHTPDGIVFAYTESMALVRVPMDGAAATRVFDTFRSTSDRMSTAGDRAGSICSGPTAAGSSASTVLSSRRARSTAGGRRADLVSS